MAATSIAALACLHLLQSSGSASAWAPPRQSRTLILHPSPRAHDGLLCGHHRSLHRTRTPPLSASPTAGASSELVSILEDLDEASLPLLRIGKRVGSGSYGTVHQGVFARAVDDIRPCIAKRAWTLAELEAGVPSRVAKLEREEKERREQLAVAQRTGLASVNLGNVDAEEVSDVESEPLEPSKLKERAERCRHYWEVERHCFQKMEERQREDGVKAAPGFFGAFADDGSGQKLGGDIVEGYGSSKGDAKGHQWMVFEFVGSAADAPSPADEPAQTLLDAMELDWKDQHLQGAKDSHHLYDIQKAMHLPESYTFGDTLDAIFLSVLENLKAIHECNIVHRDLKPGNLLCDGPNQRLRLIDFGSAADLDPSPIPSGKGNALENLFSGGTQRVGYDEGIVAISPVYSAPETFVKLDDNPLAFDVFSAGLIMSQLMFNLLDERTDAGFLQQLKEVDFDLDLWLEKELAAKLRPSGLEEGLAFLGERRGLWALLKQMFQKDPRNRISSSKALERFNMITGLRSGEVEWSDDIISEVAREESYFETVIESFESCAVNLGVENMPRPLHFLASFKKGIPVGLLLAEASEVEEDGSMTSDEWSQWQRATGRALPGEVFVKGWEDSSQAAQLGLFEIGDRLRGVGELPFVDGGFERAISLINKQPKGTGTLKLHFDRISSPRAPPNSGTVAESSHGARVGGQGAWKSGGRRGNQEDTFVLHEIKNDQIGDVLLAGVFDGHAGTAASETASGILPPLFTTELMASESIPEALKNSWEVTCNTYRDGCDENGECVADYDPREGILYADTGSADLVAGTTATIAAISLSPSGTNDLTILNCGDSRTLVVGEPPSPDAGSSYVVFETRDHSPDDELEIERLAWGQEAGFDYSIPVCTNAGSYMRVGDYQYALCRSLEGSYVTSKGIVSDPDVTTLNLATSLANRRHCAMVLACDGLFEVMSSEEVGREVARMRGEGYTAGDVSKNLCGQALKKGSYDNLSVVTVYLDEV